MPRTEHITAEALLQQQAQAMTCDCGGQVDRKARNWLIKPIVHACAEQFGILLNTRSNWRVNQAIEGRPVLLMRVLTTRTPLIAVVAALVQEGSQCGSWQQ